jgi:hypothetical protein
MNKTPSTRAAAVMNRFVFMAFNRKPAYLFAALPAM